MASVIATVSQPTADANGAHISFLLLFYGTDVPDTALMDSCGIDPVPGDSLAVLKTKLVNAINTRADQLSIPRPAAADMFLPAFAKG